MKFNRESRILAVIALVCITMFLFSFTKKEENPAYGRYQIDRTYKDGLTFYVLLDVNGNPVHFIRN